MNTIGPTETSFDIPLDPATLTADMYQLAVGEQVQYDRDPTGRVLPLIRGLPARAYMLMGANEEFIETVEPDGLHGYNRIARLVLPTSLGYADVTPDGLKYHVKEFGDFAWYCTNLLSFNHIRLASTLRLNMQDVRIADFDEFARFHATQDDDRERWQHSGFYFMDAGKTFLDVAEDILRYDRQGDYSRESFYRRGALAMAASYPFVSMSVVLQSKLGSSLAGAMADNIAKIERRIRENKIFSLDGDMR